MKYLYIPVCVAACVFAAYIAGGRIAGQKCRADMAIAATARHSQIIRKIGEVNDTTYHTAVADIRRLLHQKYTISE